MENQDAHFPFTGLHVYQRAQEAWTTTHESKNEDPLWRVLEEESQQAVLSIARATARSRHNGGFTTELETARGAIHAAGAIADQLARRGTPVDEQLQDLLSDAARMLGALIRTLQTTQAAEPEAYRDQEDERSSTETGV